MTRTERDMADHAPAGEDLAHGVCLAAHDLNNLCASMLGFAALTQDSLDPDSPLQAYLAEILSAAEKTAALAEHLRRLAGAATASRS